jgi:asparagine N-glycosylation enzyme membrane subunit Stt3
MARLPAALKLHPNKQKERRVMLGTVLLIVLILLLLGALPTWPYSGSWGYYPSGGLGLVLVIVVILLLLGKI